MVLHAEGLEIRTGDTFRRMIIQIVMRRFQIGGQRFRQNIKPMILRSDFNPPGLHVFDRLVNAVMTEFQFTGGSAHSLAQDLMTKTDAEQGILPST